MPTSVELDAIGPGQLRNLVEAAIQRYLPPDQLEMLEAAEEIERTILRGIIGWPNGGSEHRQ